MSLLSPQRIRDIQFNPLLLTCFSKLALKFTKGGMNFSLIAFQMQDLAHLLFRITAGAGVGHRQAGRDAVRRKEEIPRCGLELAVEVQRKCRVRVGDRLATRRSTAQRA